MAQAVSWLSEATTPLISLGASTGSQSPSKATGRLRWMGKYPPRSSYGWTATTQTGLTEWLPGTRADAGDLTSGLEVWKHTGRTDWRSGFLLYAFSRPPSSSRSQLPCVHTALVNTRGKGWVTWGMQAWFRLRFCAHLKLAWKVRRCGPKLPPHWVDVVSDPRAARMASRVRLLSEGCTCRVYGGNGSETEPWNPCVGMQLMGK